jgi:hypothetical protein
MATASPTTQRYGSVIRWHPDLPMTVHSIIAMSEALQLYLFACTLARTC